jgi:glycosyltransferase involved in cell wall biosynthesis
MRVGLDAIPLVAAKTGIGHYTEALSAWLAGTHPDHSYELISPFEFSYNPRDYPVNLTKRFTPVRGILRKWWLVGLPALLQMSPLDVFHGTNYCIPLWAPCPTVVTIHDLSLFTHSTTHESDNVSRGKRRVPLMARRASMIIAPSEWTRSEITAHLGIRPENVRVIHEAARESMKPISRADSQHVLDKHGISDKYILYVGTIEPRKNLLTLVQAYDELLRTTRRREKLVVCGGRGWLDDQVFKMVAELGLSDMIGFTGYVDDADLPALYSQAEVFVYPSLYEGFGLPPLEAMACGTCVVTSDTSSLPEVVGDAGLKVPARDWRALAATLARLLDDPAERGHFEEIGIARAATFSWERAAHETQSVYDEVFEKSKK